MYLTLGARAKQFITLLGLLLAAGGTAARRAPDVREKAARKLLVAERSAMEPHLPGMDRARAPNSGSLASIAHTVSVTLCKVLPFLAHSFLSLSCFCLVQEHNWPRKMIQKT